MSSVDVDEFLKVLSAASLDDSSVKVITYNSKKYLVRPYTHAQESLAHDEFMRGYEINQEIKGLIAPHIYGHFTASDLAAKKVNPEVHYLVTETTISLIKYGDLKLATHSASDVQEAMNWLAGCLWDIMAEYILKTNNFPTQLDKAHIFISTDETPSMYYLGGWMSIDHFDPQRASMLLDVKHKFLDATLVKVETAEEKEVRKALFLYPRCK